MPKALQKMSTTLWSGLGATLVALAIFIAPQQAMAEEELPDLEGTTYGAMLQDLESQAEKLKAADEDKQVKVLRDTVGLMAKQNLAMIRMIDALHNQVSGLIEDDDSMIQQGQSKFDQLKRRFLP